MQNNTNIKELAPGTYDATVISVSEEGKLIIGFIDIKTKTGIKINCLTRRYFIDNLNRAIKTHAGTNSNYNYQSMNKNNLNKKQRRSL